MHIGYTNTVNINPAHGTVSLDFETNADRVIIPEVVKLYDSIINKRVPIRRLNITCNKVVKEEYRQYNFLIDQDELEKNRKMQKAMIDIKKKFGKNAILKGMNLQEAATTRERNRQRGGHKSGE